MKKKEIKKNNRSGIKLTKDHGDGSKLVTIDSKSNFAIAVYNLFSEIRPKKIIETGTYLGNGSTTIIASTLKKLKIDDAVFNTIEVNPTFYQQAYYNLSNKCLIDKVKMHRGLSIPRDLLPNWNKIEETCIRNIEFKDIFIDHDENERVNKYFQETHFPEEKDNVLGDCLNEFNYKPDVILLDSAGHIGYIEFTYGLNLLQGPCYFILDDIYHIKHRKSLELISNDSRFNILVLSKEKFGFLIALFSPNMNQPAMNKDSKSHFPYSTPLNDTHLLKSSKTKKIGIGLVEHMGDIIACEPVIKHLKKVYPEGYYIWVTKKKYGELVEHHPLINQVIKVDCLGDWIKLTKDNFFDEIVDLHVNKRRCTSTGMILNKLKGNPDVDVDHYYTFGCLLSAFSLGAGLPPLNEKPELFIPKDIVNKIDQLSLPNKYIVLHCTSNEISRDWERDKWLAVASFINKKWGIKILEVGETPLLEKELYSSGFYFNLCDTQSLLENAEIIKRAICFLGVDSGPAHMANAVGTYGIILLGWYRNFKKYMPFSGAFADGTNATIIINENGPAKDISIESVLTTIEKYMDNQFKNKNEVKISPKLICFYLPQFHPIPENNQWWGKGFTEWTNVAKAKPIFDGHYQPHIPADLGFYDLRLPEARSEQADLARQYGIYGFCYYHYWFNGKRLIGRPFDEVRSSGKPDFPFCLCWANEKWTRAWDGRTGIVLQEQTYSLEDDKEHIHWLLEVFKDPRYITVEGKPLFLVYRAMDLPNPARMLEMWREEARKSGFKGLYLCRVESFDNERNEPRVLGFDAAVEFQPDWVQLRELDRIPYEDHLIFRYLDVVDQMLKKPIPSYVRYPCVTPSWDNSPRRKNNATLIIESSPLSYERWLREVVLSIGRKNLDESFVFINAWNEWGEGNHLEPDQKYGRAYLEATRRAISSQDDCNQRNLKFERYKHIIEFKNSHGLEKTIIDLQALIGEFPDLADAHNDLGVLYSQKKDHLKSLYHHEQAIRLDPHNVNYLKNLAAWHSSEKRDLGKAVQLCKKILSLAPNDVDNLLMLGSISLSLYRVDNARTFLEKVIQIEPGNKLAREYLKALDLNLKSELQEYPLDGKTRILNQNDQLPVSKDVDHNPLVSIIIPVFNNVEFTTRCLESIIRYVPGERFEVIIVDNGSSDGTGRFLRCLEGDVRIIINETNHGFSQACNQGAAVAQGEFIIFLNNDCVSTPGWLDALIKKAREDNQIGILGSKLLYPDGTIQHAGIVAGYRNKEIFPYHVYLGKPANYPPANKCREFQMVTGACLMIRTQLFRELGRFDEAYVNGHEDLDLCLRVRQAGYKVVYCPESILTHYESRTKRLIGLDNFHYQRGIDNEEGKGRKRFLKKWSSTLETDDQKIFLEDGVLLEKSPPPQKQDTRAIELKPLSIMFTMYGWNESGGGTTYPKAVTKELARRGHNLSVFYASLKSAPSQPPYSMDRMVEESVALYGVYNRPAIFIDPDHPEREIRDDNILACFRKVLDEVRPDIVHFNNFHGLTFALAEEVSKRGIPSCYTPHNYHVIDPNLYLFTSDLTLWKGTDIIGNSEALKRNPEKLTDYLKRAETTRTLLNQWVDLTLAVSTRQKDLLVQFGAAPEKIAVVHQSNPSTDLLWNDSEIAKEATRTAKRPLRFAFIGGVMPHKGVHMLVAAAQAFDPREAEFHIYGFVASGYLEQLQEIDAKKIVKFHGEYNQEDLGKMADFLDIAIVPSLWEDCAPLVLLELMAMRLPIIGAQIGGIPDFVQEGINGFLYPYNSVEALVERIKSCLAHPEEVSEMRRRLSSPHSFRAYIDHIEAIYHDLRARQKVNDRNSLLINLGRDRTPAIVWEGDQYVKHSLALINRELCLKLIDDGYDLSIIAYEQNEFGPEADPRFPKLTSMFNRALSNTVDIHIRHQWPPNLNPPPEGRWIMIQPWEFGSLPKKWIKIMKEQVDEIWVPSSFVRETFIQSGISPNRVQVIPNGINPKLFNPRIPPRNLGTIKRFKFLFVGGTIWRKGIDLLLEAYSETFSNKDDVSLVIKDMGGNSFYQGQTSCEMIKKIQSKPASPEIIYFTEDLPPTQMGTLYNACNCLVHPYRGEGFGLPIAEAMACGLPVIVTGAGACLDFCNPSVAYLLPAQKRVFPQRRIDDMETIDFPYIYEPDRKVLAETMRRIYENPVESKDIGTQARRHIVSNFTWSRGAKKIKERIKEVSNRPILRFQKFNRDQLLMKGESLFNQGDLDGAKEVFKVLLGHNKTDLEGLNNLGVIAFQQGDIEQAIKYFVEILDMEPTHYGSLDNLSQILINENNPQAAIECFQRALDHNPKDIHLLNGLGYCFVKKQDFINAQGVYGRSIALNPNQPNIHNLLEHFEKLNELYTTAA
jgi:glycosyltransferase involved in cell wall biosynthesis/GT2 family glycosyltransferase/tetratricopeptide (TPR) repeat protein/ADP-heptose:LPS heptosyltransferase